MRYCAKPVNVLLAVELNTAGSEDDLVYIKSFSAYSEGGNGKT
jgi:hypothetical protein